jgi:hypothetical protein
VRRRRIATNPRASRPSPTAEEPRPLESAQLLELFDAGAVSAPVPELEEPEVVLPVPAEVPALPGAVTPLVATTVPLAALVVPEVAAVPAVAEPELAATPLPVPAPADPEVDPVVLAPLIVPLVAPLIVPLAAPLALPLELPLPAPGAPASLWIAARIIAAIFCWPAEFTWPSAGS